MSLSIINRNKLYVPSESGIERNKYIRLTKIDKETGWFYVSVPDYLHNVAETVCRNFYYKNNKTASKNIAFANGYVVYDKKSEALDQWDSLIFRCREFLTEREKEKVILLNTEMNVYIFREDICVLRRSDIDFAKVNPLIGIGYEICYRVDDRLIDDDNCWVADIKDKIVIPYTEEREKFLEIITSKLEAAAIQINDFSELLKKDPLSIENIMKKGFLLTE